MNEKKMVVNNIKRLNVFIDEVTKQNYADSDVMTLAELKLFLNMAGFSFELNDNECILGKVKLDEKVYSDMRIYHFMEEERGIYLSNESGYSTYNASYNNIEVNELDIKIALLKNNELKISAFGIVNLFKNLLAYYKFKLTMMTDYFATNNLTLLEKIVNKYKLNKSDNKAFHVLKEELKGCDVKFTYIFPLYLIELNYNGREVTFKLNEAKKTSVQDFVKKIKFEKHAEEETSILI